MDESNELLPCPTCWLPADVVPPGPFENFPHARCVRGHDNALVPSVLEHLRLMAQADIRRTA